MIDVILAVILDWLIGDPHWFPHPVIYTGKFISWLEKLGRGRIESNKGLKLYGGVIVIITASISFLIPFMLLYSVKHIPALFHTLNVILIWTALAAKSLNIAGMRVYQSLVKSDLNEARKYISYIVGRDTQDLTREEIIRADIETISENTSDGVIAPLIFAMIGGAPLAFLYKAVNTMDSMLGYLNHKYKYIGFFPAKVDDIFNFIPARITGILMCLVSPVVKGEMVNSFKIMLRDRKNHKSPNCAYPEAATAGALKIQLGGTNTYFGDKVYKPTIGDEIYDLQERHISYTVYLMYGSEILLLVFYILVVIAYGR